MTVTYEEALASVLPMVRIQAVRNVSLSSVVGEILARDVLADRDIPPFPRAAMDGYAVVWTGAEAERAFRVVGTVNPGSAWNGNVEESDCIKIMTGAMLRLDDITGVILVGGKSSRMGRDKAMLPLSGTLVIDKVLDTLRTCLRRIILVGDRQERFEGYGLTVYPDIFTGSALGGLYTGLFKAETPYIFVSACDLPFASPSILRLILSLGEGFDAVVPLNGSYPEPLFALYHKNCLEPMKKLLDVRNYRIYDFYPQVRIRFVTSEELASVDESGKAFLNINTLEEYEAILGRNNHGR